MPLRQPGDSRPHPHHFYFPVRVENLAGLAASIAPGPGSSGHLSVIVTGGSGTIDIQNERLSLSGGSMLCCSTQPGVSLSPQHQLQGVWIEYSTFPLLSNQTNPLNDRHPLANCSTKVCTLAARLLRVWEGSEIQSPFTVQQLFTELLTELHGEIRENSQSPAHWLDRVLEYIEAHYSEDITRSQMAERAGVSPEHFSRVFRKATGQTFNEYVTLHRIRRAQKRMLTGAPNLSQLALEVGYVEGTYLSRKFKQVVGISPAAYHRKNKRIVALNFNHTASLRALEITPQLGVYSGWMERHETVPSALKLQLEGSSAAMLYNRVAAVRPDVIISYDLPGESKQLLPVAPVIELPYMQMDWREQFRMIAGIAGRQPQAEAWLRHYDQLCYEANLQLDRLLGARGTAVIWEFGTSSAYCFSSSYGHGCQILYGDLGFQPPGVLMEHGLMNRGYLEIPAEQIADYPADHIFFTSSASTAEGQRRFETLLRSARWQELDAARSGHVYLLDQPDMFYGFDPLSSLAQLKTLMRTIRSQISIGQDHIKP
ncbi:AraC family transcriptional regulator [Paenibacillus sp. FSL M7-1046]|uniref:AraC family transcriptional regulator n=1 Tax=Paenibacillus sp. FSL M7-1046 TaxID=2975315 RepID=UPI0030FAA4F8